MKNAMPGAWTASLTNSLQFYMLGNVWIRSLDYLRWTWLTVIIDRNSHLTIERMWNERILIDILLFFSILEIVLIKLSNQIEKIPELMAKFT